MCHLPPRPLWNNYGGDVRICALTAYLFKMMHHRHSVERPRSIVERQKSFRTDNVLQFVSFGLPTRAAGHARFGISRTRNAGMIASKSVNHCSVIPSDSWK